MGRTRWSGIGLIAATYIYFLVFAQFGFLHRVRESLGQGHWNLVLGVMGLAGLAGAVFTLARYRNGSGRRWLLAGFVGACVGALLAADASELYVFALSAGLSGFFLSTLTVSLVGVLGEMLPTYRIGQVCGVGTGVAYFVSNVPMVFEASAQGQCLIAALVCLGGFYCAMRAPIGEYDRSPRQSHGLGSKDVMHRAGCPVSDRKTSPRLVLLGWVCVFMVLVWADSAAFTRIQETPALKAASWSGSLQLLSLGIVHFFAAVVAGFFMHTGRWKLLLGTAFFGLWIGWLGLEHGVGGLLPAWIYAGSVSFYSTALVGFALLRGNGARSTVWAGMVYGVSGWIGSAMGIGMVNDLGTVPLGFWAAAVVFMVGGLTLIQGKAAR
jgi:MFS family permease